MKSGVLCLRLRDKIWILLLALLLLAQAEREMRICSQLAACIADQRDPSRVIHALDDILRARIFAIACGYEDADDLDTLRDDPGFRLALS